MEPFRGDSPEVKDLTLYANGGDEKNRLVNNEVISKQNFKKKYESIGKIFFKL